MPTTYSERILYGTEQNITWSAPSVAAGNFSAAGSATFTNNDATYPDAPFIRASLSIPVMGTAPTEGGSIELWGLQQNVSGTNDDTTGPATTVVNNGFYLGTFPIDLITSAQRCTIPKINIMGIAAFNAYIRNNTDASLAASGTMTLSLTPYTLGCVVA
jgi:hypothetical protein